MADAGQEKKKRPFRRYTYRGIDIEELAKWSREDVFPLLPARQRRRFLVKDVNHKYLRLYQKIKTAIVNTEPGEKPAAVKTHLRNAIILPELVGGVVAVYNGKAFASVEIKPDMVGHYFGEFAITYKPVKHGRPGIGATHSSRFVPLK
jgi:small subunit ribosomal protein S15e